MPGRKGREEGLHQFLNGNTLVQEHETHTLSKILDLRVLECEVLKLVLDALGLARTDFDVIDLHSFLAERCEHAIFFARKEQQESFSRTVISRRPTHAVNIRLSILWRINLNNPVY